MISDEQLATVIEEIVNARPGIKVMELIPLMPVGELRRDIDISAFITGMAMAERLIEVEYVLPNTNRIKSMLFPFGTEIRGIK